MEDSYGPSERVILTTDCDSPTSPWSTQSNGNTHFSSKYANNTSFSSENTFGAFQTAQKDVHPGTRKSLPAQRMSSSGFEENWHCCELSDGFTSPSPVGFTPSLMSQVRWQFFVQPCKKKDLLNHSTCERCGHWQWERRKAVLKPKQRERLRRKFGIGYFWITSCEVIHRARSLWQITNDE